MQRCTLFVAVILAFALPAGAQRYTSTTIPNVISATAMNRSGQVVGVLQNSNGFIHAFLWSKSTGVQDLGTLGGKHSTGDAVNDSGQVAGVSTVYPQGYVSAFLWSAATGMQDLGFVTWANGGGVKGLNAQGDVIGSYVPQVLAQAFIWTAANGFQDLGFGANSFALATNDNGWVVGDENYLGCHAYLWKPSSHAMSLDYPGSTCSNLVALNNLNEAAGYYTTSNESFGYTWSNGKFATLPSLSVPNQTEVDFLNSYGQVAGVSRAAGDANPHPFFYSAKSGIVDLSLPPNQYRSRAVALNNRGEMLAYSQKTSSSNYQFFDWTLRGGLHRIPASAVALNDAGQILGGNNSGWVLLSPAMQVKLKSSLNPSKSGQSVTFTATVTSIVGAPPDGENVTFQDGGTTLATVSLTKGVAKFTISSLSVGTHPIKAAYAGDVNYDPSVSKTVSQVVNP